MVSKVSVDRDDPPYKLAGALFLAIAVFAGTLLFLQFRGEFTAKTTLTLTAPRAGLVVEPGANVTCNGVEIGRVDRIDAISERDAAGARLMLEVDPDYVRLIPANVVAEIRATTVFGNKYVSFSSPNDPVAQPISSDDTVAVTTVTTEFNALFETVSEIAHRWIRSS